MHAGTWASGCPIPSGCKGFLSRVLGDLMRRCGADLGRWDYLRGARQMIRTIEFWNCAVENG